LTHTQGIRYNCRSGFQEKVKCLASDFQIDFDVSITGRMFNCAVKVMLAFTLKI